MKRQMISIILILAILVTILPVHSLQINASSYSEKNGSVMRETNTMPNEIDPLSNDVFEFEGHTYLVVKDSSIGWHEAEIKCEEMGGYLAVITSEEENNFVFNLVSSAGIPCWLGGTDEEVEGVWEWVTGEPWDYCPSKFDNRGGVQHYLVINYSGEAWWDDQSEKSTSSNGFYCNSGGYVCEWGDYTPSNNGYRQFNGHGYQRFEESLTWNEAKAKCEELGGHLLTITSEEEQSFVESMLCYGTMKAYWIGATSISESWQWITEEPFSYTHWASGEPNGSGNYADIISPWFKQSEYRNMWDDTQDTGDASGGIQSSVIGYICEWDSVTGKASFHEHEYAFFDESVSWSDAKSKCEEMGGHLVTINSAEEQAFLIDLVLASQKKNMWIGAYPENGSYKWITKEPFSYTNWASGEPNNVHNMQNAAMMYTQNASYPSGTWNDENENGREWTGYHLSDFGYICEWGIDVDLETCEHNFSFTTTKEPTCTDPGEGSFLCSIGGYSTIKEIQPLGHDFVDGVCSRCGAEDLGLDPSNLFFEKCYIADIWLNRRDGGVSAESDLIAQVMSMASLSENIYDALQADPSFVVSLYGWAGLRLIFDPVNGVNDMVLRHEDIYEALILDWVNRRMLAEGKTFSNLLTDAVSKLNDANGKVTKYKGVIDAITKCIKPIDEDLLQVLRTYRFDPSSPRFTSFYGFLNDLGDSMDAWKNDKFLNNVQLFAKVSSDVDTFFQRLTLYMIAYDMSEEMLQLLQEMYAQATNPYLKTALANVIFAYQDEAYIDMICAADFAQDTMMSFLSAYFDKIAEKCPNYNKLKTAYSVGKTFSDLEFNTSKVIDSYFLVTATQEFIKTNKKAIVALESRYRTSGTEKDAGAYVYAIQSYLDVYKIDLETSVSFIKEATEEGLLNQNLNIAKQIFGFLSGSGYESSYDSIVASQKGICANLDNVYDFLAESWKYNAAYLQTDYPEVYACYLQENLNMDRYTPQILSALITEDGKVQLVWSVPSTYTDSNTGITHYLLGTQRIDGGEISESADSAVYKSYTNFNGSPTVTVFSPSTSLNTYPKTFSVRAYSQSGNEQVFTKPSPSVTVSVPNEKVTLIVEKSYNALKLVIFDPSMQYYSNIRYHILRAEDGNSFFEVAVIDRNTEAGDSRTVYFDSSLAENKTYTYQVISELTFSNGTVCTSTAANSVCIRNYQRSYNPFLKLRDLRVRTPNRDGEVNSGIELRWDPIDGAAGYVISRKASFGSTFLELATLDAGADSYVDATVETTVSYEYVVVPFWTENDLRVYEPETYLTGRSVCAAEPDADTTDCTHQFLSSRIQWEATEAEEGLQLWTCALCGAVKAEVLPRLEHEHQYMADTVAPTCTEGGYTTYTCFRCGDSYVAEETAAMGHHWNEPEYVWAEDFSTVTATRTCKNDASHVETETANTTSEVTTPATCTAKGKTTYTATFTNSAFATQTKTVENVSALGHTPAAAVKENETTATCTETGGYDMVVRCAVCHEFLYSAHFETAAIGHNYQAVLTEPTCTEAGYTTYTCSRCGDSYVADKTSVLGHTPGEPVKEKELAPTCIDAGSFDMVCYCTVCGTEINRESTDVPALGHDYVHYQDLTEIIFLQSGKMVVGKVYDVYRCTRCGTEDKRILPLVEEINLDPKEIQTYGLPYQLAEIQLSRDIYSARVYLLNDDGTLYNYAIFKPDGNDPYLSYDEDADKLTFYWNGLDLNGNHPFGTVHLNLLVIATGYGDYEETVETSFQYIFGDAPVMITNPFTDVKDGDWFKDAVLWAVSQKPAITNGTTPTTFSPYKTCTRAEVVQFLWNAAGQPVVDAASNPFVDVKETDWFYKSVMWAVANGITNGTDATHFAPSKKCTRAEVVTFLRNASTDKKVTNPANPFSDVKSSDWFYNSVLWAVEHKITSGTTPTTFAPTKTCTRAEVVQFLYNASK